MGVAPEDTWEDTTQLHGQKEAVSGQLDPALPFSGHLCGRTGLRVLCGPKGLGSYQTPKFSFLRCSPCTLPTCLWMLLDAGPPPTGLSSPTQKQVLRYYLLQGQRYVWIETQQAFCQVR